MAHKSPTYVKLGGTATNRQIKWQGWPTKTDSTWLLTMFVRILHWPAEAAPLWVTSNGTTVNGGSWGLYLYADEFANTTSGGRGVTGDEYCLGVTYSVSTGASLVGYAKMDPSGGLPGRLGTIHQIQMAQKYNSSDGKTYTAVFVNGVSCFQVSTTGYIDNNEQSDETRIGGDPLLWFGTIHERACFDVIQIRYEVDRSLTISAGAIVAPDSLLDPWEELSLSTGVDEDYSGVWRLNDGTGNTVACDEGNLGPGGGVALVWADEDEVDPIVDEEAGTATWTFSNVYGYPVEPSDAAEVYPQPVFCPSPSRPDETAGELRLRMRPTIWREHGWRRATGAKEWGSIDAMSGQSASHVAYGQYAMYSGYTGAVESIIADIDPFGGASASKEQWLLGWFYDSGGTGTNTQHRFGLQTALNVLKVLVGIRISDSSSYYVTMVADSGGTIVSSVPRSTGLHEIAIYSYVDGSSDILRIYFDGALLRQESGAGVAGGATIPVIRHRMDADDDDERAWWDWLALNWRQGSTPSEFEGLVSDNGSIVLPICQPASVSSWDGVAFTDETSGSNSQEVGTIAYTFRYSTDGGSSWSSPATLNDANLQAVPCDGDGDDALEVTVELDSGMDGMSSPAARRIEVSFSSGRPARVFHHRLQMGAGIG